MEKRWILRQAAEESVSSLSQCLCVRPLLGRILYHRGLTEPQSARTFLSASLRHDLPSPFLMSHMDQAVQRLSDALDKKELICVWGDYDVDGTTGASALVSFLREIGGNAIFYVPHRIDEGYGLNWAGLKRVVAQGVRLVVSVDCGISNFEEVRLAREMGVDLIVVDHHQPPARLPPALAILNPHRADCPFPDKGLSGAGLAFYLIIGLRAKLRTLGKFGAEGGPDIRRHLDVVTLGTIADMVPLTGINRVLTKRGLAELGRSSRPGILALKEVAGITSETVGAGQVAFHLGPRINAAGRVDAGLKVVEMLTTESHEKAMRIARELDCNNMERREMETRVLGEALEQIDADGLLPNRISIVVGAEGWHPGVLGIVASRIVERYHRPTVVIGFAGGEGKGSARSIRGLHMVEALTCCAELLEKFGGHEYAGGLSIRQDNMARFADRFEQAACSQLDREDLIPLLEVDAMVEFRDIGLDLAREFKQLQPFGVGNPEPLLMTRGVEVVERREIKGGARFRLRQGGRFLDGVCFNVADDFPARQGTAVDLVYRLSENQWNGTYSVQLRIVDARLTEGGGVRPPASLR